MKNKNPIQPNRGQFTVLRQVCQLIPPHLVSKTARVTGVDEKSRTYSAWSHVVTMLYAQISHALSLNDVCDALRLRVGSLFTVRGARPPAKNTLSYANKVRDCAMRRSCSVQCSVTCSRRVPRSCVAAANAG